MFVNRKENYYRIWALNNIDHILIGTTNTYEEAEKIKNTVGFIFTFTTIDYIDENRKRHDVYVGGTII